MRKVSLYIPCYNAKKYIEKCLEAVFRQIYPIDEILVIDDGPGDEVASIVSDYPVKFIRRKERLGLSSARNMAFQLAKNEFVASIDADSIPKPEWLERLMDNFTEEDIAGIGGRVIEKYNYTLPDKWRAVHMKQHWGDRRLVNPHCLVGNNSLFRKSAVLDIGLFDERYKIGYEDVDISKRLKQAGYKIIYEPEAIVYHMRQDTLSSLLRTHWNWNFVGVEGRRTPDNLFNLCCKTYDSFIYSLRRIKKDIITGRYDFLYIDTLIFPYHLLHDMKYYISLKYKKIFIMNTEQDTQGDRN